MEAKISYLIPEDDGICKPDEIAAPRHSWFRKKYLEKILALFRICGNLDFLPLLVHQLALLTLAAAAAALPTDSAEVVRILRDQRTHQGDGNYNLDVETGNGIILAQSGTPVGPEGTVIKAGQYA